LAKSYFEKGFKTHPNLQDFIPWAITLRSTNGLTVII
jgi:hypothetical protein